MNSPVDVSRYEQTGVYLDGGRARFFTPDVLSVSWSGGGMMGEEVATMETSESSEDELGRLDIDLDRKSKQHNLTSSNVRAILHVSVTHTHTQSVNTGRTCYREHVTYSLHTYTTCMLKIL